MLDTHAWLFWRDAPERLGTAAESAIADADEIGVSAMSTWEVATLVRRGRLALDRDVSAWIGLALAGERILELPVSSAIAAAAGGLDEPFPGDPADRMIYATSVAMGARLISRDQRITAYDPRRVTW